MASTGCFGSITDRKHNMFERTLRQSTYDVVPGRKLRNLDVPENEHTTTYVTLRDGIIRRKATCVCGGGCPACQARSGGMKVSRPDDPEELEADRIADKVMRMELSEARPAADTIKSPKAVHRKCNSCEEEEEETLQRKPLPSGGGVPSQSPAHVRDAVSSGGQPLDRETRSFFEPRFRHDFSRVRVHNSAKAAESARAVNAKAYTVGRGIVFGNGEYAPGTDEGRRLISHELAHIVHGVDATPRIQRTKKRGNAGGCGICMNDPTGTTAGTIAHYTIQIAFQFNNSDLIGEYAIPVVEAGTAPPFVPEVDLFYRTYSNGQRIAHIGEIKPLDDAGKQVGIARNKLKDYARELRANPELQIDEVFRMSDNPPKPIVFPNPERPPGCPVQKIHVQMTEPGIYQYYCEPPWSELVADPRCKCKKKQKEDEKEKAKELQKPQSEEDTKEKGLDKPETVDETDTDLWTYVPPAILAAGSAAVIAYLRQKAIKEAEKRAAQLAWRKLAEAAAARRAAAAAGKKVAGETVAKAAAYVEIAAAAALVIFYSDRVDAKPNLGPSPIESLYKMMTTNGTPPSPEMKALIESDPILKSLAEEAYASGDGSKLQEEMARRTMEMIKNNPGMFTPEDLELLSKYSKTAESAQSPETAEALRMAVDMAKAGKTVGGGTQPEATTPAPAEPDAPGKTQPFAGAQLSEENIELLKGASEPVTQLLNSCLTNQKLGAEIDNNEFISRFFEIVPPDLTEEQFRALIERLKTTPGATPDAMLESLRKAVEDVRKSSGGAASSETPSRKEPDITPEVIQESEPEPETAAPAGTSTEAKPATEPELSDEDRKNLIAASPAISRLYNMYASKLKTSIKIEDTKFINGFFKIVPADLTEEQAKALIKRLKAAPGATPDTMLESLKKGVEEVRKRAGGAASPATTGKSMDQVVAELKAIAAKYDFSKIPEGKYKIMNFLAKVKGNTITTQVYGKDASGVGYVGFITGTVPPGTDMTKLKEGDSVIIEITYQSPLVDNKGNVLGITLGSKVIYSIK